MPSITLRSTIARHSTIDFPVCGDFHHDLSITIARTIFRLIVDIYQKRRLSIALKVLSAYLEQGLFVYIAGNPYQLHGAYLIQPFGDQLTSLLFASHCPGAVNDQ